MIWFGVILAGVIALPQVVPGDQAVRAARESATAAIISYGGQHPATAIALSNLGLALEQAGYPNYAEYYAHQAVSILEKNFGSDDVSLVPPLNVLAESAALQGHFSVAARLARRAVGIGPDAGPHYATALHNLAEILRAEGKGREASRYRREELSFRALPADRR